MRSKLKEIAIEPHGDIMYNQWKTQSLSRYMFTFIFVVMETVIKRFIVDIYHKLDY